MRTIHQNENNSECINKCIKRHKYEGMHDSFIFFKTLRIQITSNTLTNSYLFGTTIQSFNINIIYECLNLELKFLPEFCLVQLFFKKQEKYGKLSGYIIPTVENGRKREGIKSTLRRKSKSLCFPDLQQFCSASYKQLSFSQLREYHMLCSSRKI